MKTSAYQRCSEFPEEFMSYFKEKDWGYSRLVYTTKVTIRYQKCMANVRLWKISDKA